MNDKPTTIVIVPGYNEPDNDMLTLADGRRGMPGLGARGYHCLTFPQPADDLSDRIDQFAAFVEKIEGEGEARFPIVTLGFSLGGLVVRGYLRRYPERSHKVAVTMQLATPNWGLTADLLPMIAAFLRLRDHALADLDINSKFMRWLNGTGGSWMHTHGRRDWILDAEPWIAPPDAKLHVVTGLVPRFGDTDGIVRRDSATLGGRIASTEIRAARANHLNLIGAWNLGTTLIKGFTFDDNIWPLAVAAIADAIEENVRDTPAASPRTRR